MPAVSVPDAPGWRAVSLDDVAAIAWRGGELRWHPLRHAPGTALLARAPELAEPLAEDPDLAGLVAPRA